MCSTAFQRSFHAKNQEASRECWGRVVLSWSSLLTFVVVIHSSSVHRLGWKQLLFSFLSSSTYLVVLTSSSDFPRSISLLYYPYIIIIKEGMCYMYTILNLSTTLVYISKWIQEYKKYEQIKIILMKCEVNEWIERDWTRLDEIERDWTRLN